MDAQQNTDGRTRLSLGTVEKAIASAIGAGCVALAGWLVVSVSAVLTQQQVTNQQMAQVTAQMQQITTQLQDVPTIKLEVAKAQLRLDQHDQDIRELKQLRGLK
ncbi:hypothetical protein CKY51_07100 [Xanthomonas maliensis]|nr:hypothetical protein CKY51_07100 [Xanthomonas maliensis]